MKGRYYCSMLLFFAIFIYVNGQGRQYYAPHVTAQDPWVNKVVVYNNGDQEAAFALIIWNGGGQVAFQDDYAVSANGSLTLVMSNFSRYVAQNGEIVLPSVEGALMIETESEKIRPKASFRYGDSPSLTEFFLQETVAWEYILPNSVQSHFSWTGVAVLNPDDESLVIRLRAYQNGVLAGDAEETINPRTKYVNLAGEIWDKIGYTEFDQIRISTSSHAFPPPMSITGNTGQDRHVFFNGAVTSTSMPSGNLYTTDSIVGDLNFVKADSFTQGSPADEFCRNLNEEQFTHELTRNLAVMTTEVTRQMWADLKTAQPTLPADPSEDKNTGPEYPAQSLKWYETVLFANLLSVEQGLTPCYYTDPGFSTPVTAANYETDMVYCNFDAAGYRLPTEGEWEFFCRAGTTSPFWMDVPNYDWRICGQGSCEPGTFPGLENAAWFCASQYDPQGDDSAKPAGLKDPNPWGLYDVIGNVWEWCWDWYDEYPAETATSYSGAATGTDRLTRGAAWLTFSSGCRSAHRRPASPATRRQYCGFRLVRTVQ